jgi:hypothetical protein
MRRITKTVLALAFAAGMAWQAKANLVTPAGNLVVGYNDTQSSMSTLLGMNVTELWKWDNGSSSLNGNGFTVSFSADMLQATLSWDLTGTGTQLFAAAWKDGVLVDTTQGNLGFYWSAVTDDARVVSNDADTGTLTVQLSPAFKNPTAWSHIAFYGTGTPGGGTNVPDGGSTLALVGIAITGLGVLRRKLS